MRTIGLGVAIGLFSLNGLRAADSGAIPWYQSLDQASRVAREANKPMLLDFWADWCAACRVMEKEVYTDPSVIEAASTKFLPVKVDFDHEEKLARKYNVTTLPTILFTDSYGTELFRQSGFLEAKAFAELLKALPGDVSRINRLRQVLAEDKENFEALDGLGGELRENGLFRLSNEYYRKVLKTDPAKKDPRQRERILVAMGWNHVELRESQQAVKVFESCLKEFPNSDRKPVFLLGLGQAYVLAGAQDKARKVLATLMDQYPGTENAREARGILEGSR